MFLVVFIVSIAYIMIGLIVFEIINNLSVKKKDLDTQIDIIMMWPVMLIVGLIVALIEYLEERKKWLDKDDE